VEVVGKVADSATGAAVQNHPAEALALAANDLDLPAGPGSRTAFHFTTLGSIFISGGQ